MMETLIEQRDDDVATEESETVKTLRLMARGKTGAIPPNLLIDHVLTIAHASDWPLQRAAMEALLRRISFAKRDKLRITARPTNKLFGIYGTRSQKSSIRPYRSLLTSLT